MNAEITRIYLMWLSIWEKTPNPSKRALALEHIRRMVMLYEDIYYTRRQVIHYAAGSAGL